MNIKPKNLRKFQIGGEMPESSPVEGAPVELGAPVEENAPVEGGVEDPMSMLFLMAALALLALDCQAMALVCQALLEIGQQVQGGASVEPQGQPVFRKGGIIVRRIKK